MDHKHGRRRQVFFSPSFLLLLFATYVLFFALIIPPSAAVRRFLVLDTDAGAATHRRRPGAQGGVLGASAKLQLRGAQDGVAVQADPSLKAPGFKTLIVKRNNSAFNLKPCFTSEHCATTRRCGGCARPR